MDQTTRARLATFAKRLKGSLGPIPLDRAIRSELDLFDSLRATGSTWSQIANALAAAGALRPDGGAISPDHLRSAVSRQLKRVESTEVSSPREADPAATPQKAPKPAKRPNTASRTPVAAGAALSPNKPPPAVKKAAVSPPSKSADRSKSSVLEKLARTRQLRET